MIATPVTYEYNVFQTLKEDCHQHGMLKDTGIVNTDQLPKFL